MQRYALSKEGDRIFADVAASQVDYVCPECLGKLRLKKGEIKTAHFFHFEEARVCRWKTRFQTHTAIQEILSERLGILSCTIECAFPEISRIADVAYHPMNIVFEIQLSPISEKELAQRTIDYWSVNWHVIWILHIEQYGGKRASSAEEILQNIPHYFTDLGSRRASLWDEASYAYKKRRFWFMPLSRAHIYPFQLKNRAHNKTPRDSLEYKDDSPIEMGISSLTPVVHFSPPQKIEPSQSFSSVAAWYEKRKSSWSCSLLGDFLSHEEPPRLSSLKKIEIRPELYERIRTFFYLLWIRISGA